MIRALVRAAAAALLVIGLAGCEVDRTFAPLSEVEGRAWAEGGQPSLTLVTAIGNRDGSGGHSALVVSGSQRVLFDPAGTWRHPTVPERGDVLYGMTPTMMDFYIDYHARPAYHVVLQRVAVSPATAERALQLVRDHGPASKATCGRAVSGILRELGFEEVDRRWFPDRIMRDFASVPGVVETKVYDDTEDPWSPERRGGAGYDVEGQLIPVHAGG